MSSEFPQKQQELFEAVVGLAAVVMLSAMVLWMRKVARSIKQALHVSLDAALAGSRHQAWALIGMVFFAVAREGLETVFFLLAVFQQSSGPAAPLGALLGLLAAVLIGVALYSGSLRLNLSQFFRWTGLFILVVAAGILANAMQALHEAGVWNALQAVVFDSSAVLPQDGPTGSVLAGMFGYQDTPTVSTLGAYLLYLIGALLLFFWPVKASPSSSSNAQGPA